MLLQSIRTNVNIVVVYLLQCPCSLQYVGRTLWALQVRINKHIGHIRKGFKGHNLSKHYRLHHNRHPSSLTLVGIERYYLHWRRSHCIRGISPFETHWIYSLKTYYPYRLTKEWDLNSFIINSENKRNACITTLVL